MSDITSQIIPAQKILEYLKDSDLFLQWLSENHPEVNANNLFEGYQFAVNCCINTLIDGICDDSILEIKSDFLVQRAIVEVVPINEIKTTCEKTIFLKILKPYVKEIAKAKTYHHLDLKLGDLDVLLLSKVAKLFEDHIELSAKFDLESGEALKWLLINFTHTYLVQIKNNGPIANFLTPLSVNWVTNDLLSIYLEGYKYTIQYLWYRLLGKDEFNKTHLTQMHLADSWRRYKYAEKENLDDVFSSMFNTEFNLEEQTCFDSFFYWIQKEITEDLYIQHKIHSYDIDRYFIFNSKNYEKNDYFSYLLNEVNLKQSPPEPPLENRLQELLYWYPFEVVDAYKSSMHFGLPSFNTMLAGTIKLHDPKESEFSKIVVAKFTHPHLEDARKKDYSFGILIDAKSSAGHYSSGWVIYQNACGDYSGFSSSEYRISEELIKKYNQKGKIDLREIQIPLEKFKDFTNRHSLNEEGFNALEDNKRLKELRQVSKSYLFELFTYYVFTRYYLGKGYSIEINSDKKSEDGEKDVVVFNDNELILVECKLNPNNQTMDEVLQKMENKLNNPKFIQENKTLQFWFWGEPSEKSQLVLDQIIFNNQSIKYVVVSNPKGEQLLKGVDLRALKRIMQDD